ncbi:GNAT family N-acetyltransferase [Planococcus sp. NCCP-2050]|uniref:GNAT family N-acetyltransferase n=1 Tax=Planococcus sp. NCCP-2050 TaxID=2944679 RepID=UPI00203B8EE0|nr:GNAT family protein [Planococcus sp. NCCP-2050]GKW46034.1 N-acetyltransferase [Planococcus sp. NCCP-2050]
MNEPIEKRIQLREIVEEDWGSVHAYASLEIVSRHQAWGPNSEEDSRAYVHEVLKEAEAIPRRQFVFAIAVGETKKMIGAVELNIRDEVNRTGEIGYILHPDFWGRGIAGKAADQVLQFAFNGQKLHRVFATCDPRNTASYKVLEKLGMSKEGRLRENIQLRDGWRDSFVYSILEQEWRESRQ